MIKYIHLLFFVLFVTGCSLFKNERVSLVTAEKSFKSTVDVLVIGFEDGAFTDKEKKDIKAVVNSINDALDIWSDAVINKKAVEQVIYDQVINGLKILNSYSSRVKESPS